MKKAGVIVTVMLLVSSILFLNVGAQDPCQTNACLDDTQCASGETCVEFCCAPAQAPDCLAPCVEGQCNTDQSCVDGCCTPNSCDTQCASDADCAFDHKCGESGCCMPIPCTQNSDCPGPCPEPAGISPNVFFPLQCNFCQDGFCLDPAPVCNPVCGECQQCSGNPAACAPQTGPPCTSDGNPCTNDRCFVGTCTHELDPGCCTTDVQCGVCEACDQNSHMCQPNDGAPCDDGNLCTIGDMCDNQANCEGMPKECADVLACNGDETCNEQTGDCQPGTPVNCLDDICDTCQEPSGQCQKDQNCCVTAGDCNPSDDCTTCVANVCGQLEGCCTNNNQCEKCQVCAGPASAGICVTPEGCIDADGDGFPADTISCFGE